MIQPGDIVADDLTLLLIRYVLEDTVDDLARPGKSRLSMGIVGAPHQVIDAHIGPGWMPERLPETEAFWRKKSLYSAMFKTLMGHPCARSLQTLSSGSRSRGPGNLKFDGATQSGKR